MESDAKLRQAADMSDAMLQNARTLRQQGNSQRAADLYHEVLRRNPKQSEALKTLGQIYFETGQLEKARYLLDEALRIDPSDLDNLCIYGVVLMQLGRRDEAIASFTRALTFNPNFVHALVNRATALQEMGYFEEALRDFALSIKLDPTHAGAINNIGTTYVAMKRFPEAVASYDRALELEPNFTLARDNRRKALLQAHGTSGAPDVARYLHTRGAELLQKDAHAEALILFDEALGLEPLMAEAASSRDTALAAMGQLEEAGGAAQYLCARGVQFLRQRRPADALISFDEALKLEPDMIEAMSNRATALFEMGRAEEAIIGFDTALALDAMHAVSWNNRGNALASLGRHEEAVTSYDKALALQPGLAQAAENRANALFDLKRLDRCPPNYMRRLFDDFSSHYDSTMLEKLQYRAHLHVRELAARALPSLSRPQRILDLGSGTGLVGDAFKDMAKGGRLDGIDLSPRMIEEARKRGIYDDLILGDIETVLSEPGQIYDLILAADTMIYLGDLEKVFSGVARRLDAGGFYLFAVEAKQGEGWEQTQTHRFRHSDPYLRETAAKAGLATIEIVPCTLRMEHGTPVAGFTVALRKQPPSS